jgi:hypothetical protein
MFHHNPERFVFGAFVKIGYFETGANLIRTDRVLAALAHLWQIERKIVAEQPEQNRIGLRPPQIAALSLKCYFVNTYYFPMRISVRTGKDY